MAKSAISMRLPQPSQTPRLKRERFPSIDGETASGLCLSVFRASSICPTNLNSRILLTLEQDGTYRVIATCSSSKVEANEGSSSTEYAGKQKQPKK
jgi:hypothetical protein